jgi:hypothetical protein
VVCAAARSTNKATNIGVCTMRIALFAPYGTVHRESGLLYLVANYLAKNGAQVLLLRCDGAVPACQRVHNERGSVEREGGRSPFECARCMNEQRDMALWAGIQIRDISSLIVPEDVRKTAEWIYAVKSDALDRVEFRGVNLWSACTQAITARWGTVDARALTAAQVDDLRALFISYVRVAVASERLIDEWKPDQTVLTSIQDPMAHAYLLQASLASLDTSVCSYVAEENSIVFESLKTKERYATSLVLEGIASMRSDPRTWGPEVTAVVHEVLTYLGCAPDRVQ